MTKTPTRLVASLVADCKRETGPQARTRIASLLAYRLAPVLIAAIEAEDFTRARELIAAYWRYLGEPANAQAALQASDKELTLIARGYRTRLARREGTPLCVLARARAYARWLGRLRRPDLSAVTA